MVTRSSTSTMTNQSSFLGGLITTIFKRSSAKVVRSSSNLPEGLCRRFSLAEIKAATNNFDAKFLIGEGGFGPIYKGTIEKENFSVAVKCLSQNSYQGIHEFQTEVILLCQVRHPNLVPLIGFCDDKKQKIIVFPYMSHGSLEHHIHGCHKQHDRLPWKRRLKICIGAARGVHSLHAGAKRAIVHRNIKASNILVGENWEAKISGFGLSKLGPISMSKSPIKMELPVYGTYGYADPAYVATGLLTDKSDVFSFGAVLLEVLCSRRVFDRTLTSDQQLLADGARKCIENGTVDNIIDPHLKGKIAPECLKKFLEIAYDCTHPKGDERPTMGEVEMTLELALELQERFDSAIEAMNANGEYL